MQLIELPEISLTRSSAKSPDVLDQHLSEVAQTKAEPQPQWSVHQLHLKYPTPMAPLLGDLRVWFPTGLSTFTSDSSVFFILIIIISGFMVVCEDICPSRFFGYLPHNPVAPYT